LTAWREHDDLTPEDLRGEPWFGIGKDTAETFMRREEWLFRRVESIEFIARRSVRRRVSVDFEIPADLPPSGREAAGGANLVPVSVLHKDPPLMDFDLCSPDDLPMSFYKRATNRKLDFGLLMGMAELTLRDGAKLSQRLVEAIEALIIADKVNTSGVEFVAAQLERELSNDARYSWDMHDEIAATVDLAAQLGASALLWVPVFGEPRSDQIVKFSYVDAYNEPRVWWKRILVGCSWWERTLFMAVRHAGTRTRFHMIVAAPSDGVELTHATTIGFRSSSQSTLKRSGSAAVAHEAQHSEGGDTGEPLGESVISDRLAHLYLGNSGERSHRVVLKLRLAAARDGFISGCVLAGAAIAVLMSVVFAELPGASRAPDKMAVLLAAVPVVLGYVLVRPGENAWERYHVVGVRVLALTSGAMPILGALTLELTPLATARPWWAALLITSWVIVAGLVLSWLFAAPSHEERHRGRLPRAARSLVSRAFPTATRNDRQDRWPRIAQLSGVVTAAGLLAGTQIECQPYSHVAGRALATYLREHRLHVLTGAALAGIGFAAMYPFLGGIWRAISTQRGKREHTAASLLIVGTGLLTVSLALLSNSLIAWQALSATKTTHHATIESAASVAKVADVMANLALVPTVVLIGSATIWLLLRIDLSECRFLIAVAGAGGLVLVTLRVASLARIVSLHPSATSGWIGLGAWAGTVTIAFRLKAISEAWLFQTGQPAAGQ
jgi:hypothetical protein